MDDASLEFGKTFVTALYRGILNREPDSGGLAATLQDLEKGVSYAAIVQRLLASPEFRAKHPPEAPPSASSAELIITALYRGILNRDPEARGLAGALENVANGAPYEAIIRGMLASAEFQSQQARQSVPATILPSLLELMPEHYETSPEGYPIFKADQDGDFDLLARLIQEHRYYDSFGIWSPRIDLDKIITATIARGLGASTVFELGCFTGPVLSVLLEAGVDVTGMDASHLAFSFAYPSVRAKMIYGDLLSHEIVRTYDVVLAMDILEHLNPLILDRYISRLALLLNRDGFLYLNSPMIGPDDVFGHPFPSYLPEWDQVGDASFWRRLHCDAKGWPVHGHLVWASPVWWERQFKLQGLVRDREVEAAIHKILAEWFEIAPGRRSLFVLKRATNQRSSRQVAENVTAALAGLENLPRPQK